MPILDLSFDTGDVSLESIHDNLAVTFSYPKTIQGEFDKEKGTHVQIPNPESKVDYNRRMFKELIINRVFEGERAVALEKAEKKIKPIELT